VRGGIPRFVAPENYASSFGFQWNRFSRVQLDSYNGSGHSAARFEAITGWSAGDLQGKLVLDAGCGAGRFAEVVAGMGARLAAVDLSSAVEACRSNLAPRAPLICQASIYDLPFAPASFDYVYSIGVIQHTPDPLRAVRCLARLVRPGGQIGLWIYDLTWRSFVGTSAFKYALRPLTRRLPRDAQVRWSRGLVDLFYPLTRRLMPLGAPGRVALRLLPVPSAYLQGVRLTEEDLRTWMFLDTFDMYSPAYDRPQRFGPVVRLLEAEGFHGVTRQPHPAIALTATRNV
jgi:SAM-dependent methyltransferase